MEKRMADGDSNNMVTHLLGPDGRERGVVAYEITDEPVDDGTVPPIPAELADEFERLHEQVATRPASAVGRLEELVDRYPHLPALANWLTMAYAAAGRDAEADAVVDRLVREHPDYLFGRLALADRYLRAGQLDRVPEPLGGLLDLKMIYPDRSRFHISEAIGLGALVGEWSVRKGDLDAAGRYHRLMEDFAPDHLATERLGLRLLPLQMAAGFATLLAGSRPWAAKKVAANVKAKGKTKAKKPDPRRPPGR